MSYCVVNCWDREFPMRAVGNLGASIRMLHFAAQRLEGSAPKGAQRPQGSHISSVFGSGLHFLQSSLEGCWRWSLEAFVDIIPVIT